jgi:hypothetical protein
MVAGGAAWITLMATFNTATQSAAPSWLRARALALYLLMFHGSMAAGSAVWGAVTEHGGLSMALLRAAGGLMWVSRSLVVIPSMAVRNLI